MNLTDDEILLISALLYNSVPKNDSPFSVYSEFFRDPRVLSLKEKIYKNARERLLK